MKNLFVACTVLLTAVLLMMPALQQSRERSRSNACIARLRTLATGTTRRVELTSRFPIAMTGTHAAGHIDNRGPVPFSRDDGYSWIVSILPYMNDANLFDEVMEASEETSLPMNSPRLSRIHSRRMPELICPSVPDQRQLVRGQYKDLGRAYVSNYLALTSAFAGGRDQRFADRLGSSGIITMKRNSPKGFKAGDIGGGTSNTILFGESKAELYSFWFSGRSTSTVATPPDLGTPKRTVNSFRTAINYGRDRLAPVSDNAPWFAEKYPPGEQDWGVSSHHPRGMVAHGYADGHVKFLSDQTDARTYVSAVTHAAD